MHLPQNLIGPASRNNAQNSLPEAVQISNQHGCLKEFGVRESDVAAQSFVCVSPMDKLTLNYKIPTDDEEEIIDLVVDGVLRETSVKRKKSRIHRGNFMNVYYYPKVSRRRGKLQRCDMIVEDRTTDKELRPIPPASANTPCSAVGTIEVRILRKLREHGAASVNSPLVQACRGATYDRGEVSSDVSRRVEAEDIVPTYKIGFSSSEIPPGNSRKSIHQETTGFYLWASLKFLYRSASSLRAAGFDVGAFYDISPNNAPDPNSSQSDQKTTTIGQPASAVLKPSTKSSPARSTALPSEAKSDIMTTPLVSAGKPTLNVQIKTGAETRKILNGENMEADLVIGGHDVQAEHLTPAVFTESDNQNTAIVASRTDHVDPSDFQSRVHGEGDTASVEYEHLLNADTEIEQGETRVQDIKSNSVVRLSASARRDAVSVAENAIEIQAREAAAMQIQHSRPCLPGMGIDLSVYRRQVGEDTDSDALNEGDNTTMSRSQSASAGLMKLEDKSSIFTKAMAGITQISVDGHQSQFRPYEDAHRRSIAETERLFKRANSLESSYATSQGPQSPTTRMTLAGASRVERPHRPQAKMFSDDLGAAQKAHTSLGLSFGLSQLDQDEGKSNSSHGFASFAETSRQAYNTPPITPAKGLAGNMSTTEDHKGKRSFEDFREDVNSPSASRSNRAPSVFINGEWSPPPKFRREEHARKIQARQEALNSIRLETAGLRKRVTDIEASQVEDRAREKAQLAEMDAQFEETIRERKALMDYLEAHDREIASKFIHT